MKAVIVPLVALSLLTVLAPASMASSAGVDAPGTSVAVVLPEDQPAATTTIDPGLQRCRIDTTDPTRPAIYGDCIIFGTETWEKVEKIIGTENDGQEELLGCRISMADPTKPAIYGDCIIWDTPLGPIVDDVLGIVTD